MLLTDAVAIITGGKRIGRVVARELAQRGVDLVLSYRGSKAEAEATVADVEAAGRRATIVQADVAEPADCAAIVDHAVQTFGKVDVLVNMASIYRSTPLEAVTPDYWAADLDVNLRSAFLCAHAAIPHMRKAGGGRIVNFADWLARSGRPHYTGFTSYYVAKAGVVALTEALALEAARDHILVNAIAPGPIVPPPDMSPGGDRGGRQGHAARPLGRRERDRPRRPVPVRDRVRHRRDHPRRRRPPPRVTTRYLVICRRASRIARSTGRVAVLEIESRRVTRGAAAAGPGIAAATRGAAAPRGRGTDGTGRPCPPRRSRGPRGSAPSPRSRRPPARAATGRPRRPARAWRAMSTCEPTRMRVGASSSPTSENRNSISSARPRERTFTRHSRKSGWS